jgi:hypothetical protein
MEKPSDVLIKLHKDLQSVTERLNKTIQNQTYESDLEGTIDYLNNMIRKLDHTVEVLLQTKAKV